MQIVILTMLALAGANPQPAAPPVATGTYYHVGDDSTHEAGPPACDAGPGSCEGGPGSCEGGPGSCEGGVGACGGEHCRHCQAARWEARQAARQARHAAHAAEHQRRHMMPQTCYAPRFGCYYSGDRHMHRYPAFHGTFYRRPTNYRDLFDYPWHAEPHEPTSLFSYNVEPAPAAVVEPVEPQARRQGVEVVPAPPARLAPRNRGTSDRASR